jgi:hypothetical protein
MTDQDVRALLVEQGAKLLAARVRVTSYLKWASAARKEWAAAAAPILKEPRIADISIDEQIQCFRESAVLAGLDPDGPELRPEREQFEYMQMSEGEERLLAQLDNAPLN